MPEPTPEAWAQIRHAYENTDRPLVDICAEYDVSIPTVRYRMKRWEWRRRKPFVPRHQPPAMAVRDETASFAETTPTPTLPLAGGGSREAPLQPTPPASAAAGDHNATIVERLQGAAARLVPAIDAAITRLADGNLPPRDVERTGRTLATLTRTLREINALLVQNNAPLEVEDDPVPKDIDEFRYELARRIRGFIAARTAAQADPAAGAGAKTAMDVPGGA